MSEYKSCDNCHYTNYGRFEYPCRECTHNRAIDHWVSRSNADRIRNMSDEQLAEFLLEVNSTIQECMVLGCKSALEGECGDCFLEWLQAEVEEGE